MIKIALLTIAVLYSDGSAAVVTVPAADSIACEQMKTEYLDALTGATDGDQMITAVCSDAEISQRIAAKPPVEAE